MGKIKIVATDLDYTLIENNKISDANLEVLKEMEARGIRLIISSGRYPVYIHRLLDRYGLQADICALNGAYIETSDRRTIYESEIPEDTALKIEDYLHEHHLYYHLYDYSSVFATMLNLKSLPHEEYGNSIKFFNDVHIVDRPVETCRRIGTGIYKIFIRKDPSAPDLKKFLDSMGQLNISSSGDENYEVNEKDTNKINGIDYILDEYGLSRNDLLAIGDHTNDLSMIEGAGIGIAMGNGCEEVLKRADAITGTFNNDGFAQAMEKYVLED